MSGVVLGYCCREGRDSAPQEKACESVDEWLHSRVGGKPGWISPNALPNCRDCKCARCGTDLVFIAQIYCPRSTGETFHRLLYVFLCWNCGQDARVFRATCPQQNEWLPYMPSENDAKYLDNLVSHLAPNCCPTCLLPTEHGSLHQRCRNVTYGQIVSTVLPASKIYVEPEAINCPAGESSDAVECPAGESSDAVECPVSESSATVVPEESESDDEEFEKYKFNVPAINKDKVLKEYVDYMNSVGPHVIRYGSERPLWFCGEAQLADEAVPACEHCGSTRKFELQIQSTLLDYVEQLANLEMSFGVLCIYTCPKDCTPFSREFIYKQRDPTLDCRLKLAELN